MEVAVHDSAIAKRIMDRAAALFARRGYAASSVREIAEAADVTKPMLYYYFDSKEGLAQAVLDRGHNKMMSIMRAAIDGQADTVEKLVALVYTHFQFCRNNRDYMQVAGSVYFGPREEVGAIEISRYGSELHALFTNSTVAICDAGLVSPRRLPLFQRAVAGLSAAWSFGLNLDPNLVLTEELTRESVRCLVRGFSADADP